MPINMPPDNWIYIQERDVRVGRLQIFNNWSPDLVADQGKVWLGLEYFCQEGDDLWRRADPAMIAFAAEELEKIGMIDRADVLDGTVIRVPKTYPGYFGAYAEFPRLRAWLDGVENLYLVGPQRHAPLQQPGPLDADREAGGRGDPRRPLRQGGDLGGECR
jgi:protoporphyrinogen oxidase